MPPLAWLMEEKESWRYIMTDLKIYENENCGIE